MKRVIVLSDTHGLLRSEVLEYLSQADIIIHGGDINTQSIVDKLREYSPLYIVRGNNDKVWAEGLPQRLTFTIEGVHFFLVHNKKDVPSDLSDTHVVVYGHSHKYACEERNGVLWLNPGSCSFPRPYRAMPTMAVLSTEADGTFSVRKVTL